MEPSDGMASAAADAELQSIIDAKLREREEAELAMMIADARADAAGSSEGLVEEASGNPMLEQYMAEHKAALEQALSAEQQAKAKQFNIHSFVEMELEMETELQKFQARMKRTVANDIRKMLSNTKAYVKFHSPPPVLSRAHLRELAAPKPQLAHPDTLLAQAIGDPSQYARTKAAQLAAKREAEERAAARHAQTDAIRHKNLEAYKLLKAQQEAEKAALKHQHQQEQQQYGRVMSQYVRDKAREELAAYKARVEVQKAKAAAAHELLARKSFM